MKTFSIKSLPISVTIIFVFCFCSTAQAWSLPAWLSSSLPDPGNGSIQDEIKCYSLPYGGMGFLSHCITYWTLLWLGASRSPWAFKRLSEWKMDACLGLLSIVATIATCALAIVRCRSTWPLILIATWKMLLGFSLGCCTIHRALDVRRQGPGEHQQVKQSSESETEHHKIRDYSATPLAWLLFYLPGVICGLTGLIAIIVEAWPTRTRAMEIIAEVFGASVLVAALLFLILGWCLDSFGIGLTMSALAAVATIGVLAALFSDWILAAIEVQGGGSWAGLPSDSVAWLWWSYFVAKRLPFFSF